MRLSFPLALIGLLIIPYLIWLGRPRGTFGRGRERASLLLRIVIVTLLVVGLAGLQIVNFSDRLAVVFLLDTSDSMGAQSRLASREYVDSALGRMGPSDEAAVITFGSDALVERPMSPVRQLAPIESAPLPHNTDLAEAIRLALALYPTGSAKRMVILSDGLPTVGDARQAARLAAASGVQIMVLPFSATTGPEVLISNVGAPTRLEEGQTFDLTIGVASTITTEATLLVSGSGVVLHEETVSLRPGDNQFVLPVMAGQAGLTAFRVQLSPVGDDAFHQNNELAAFSLVTGPSRALVVSRADADTQHLTQALLESGLLVDQTTPSGLPFDLAALSGYASVVLVDIPATQLAQRQMQTLQAYVRDLGGGLVAIGGERSYGVGGYFRTPLEEMLPVDMQLKEQERLPQVSIVFVIDKSGSMADLSRDGTPKVELAKEAINRSVQLLGPLDRVGVVAFDDQSAWVVELRPADDPDAIADRVATIRADGGTDILDGLLTMSLVLPDDPAQLKHTILLTDGGANPDQIPELVSRLFEESGVTLSVVAIGEGYAPFLEDLPQLADGRFHAAFDPGNIPQIFTEETLLATRAYIIEEEFTPEVTASNAIIQGLSDLQPLRGYIGTSIKPAAQQILATHRGDPLLAAWRYGLGRSVAWTSDATSRWAVDWIGSDDFPRLWSQAVRWTITEGISQNVEVNMLPQGEQTLVVVDTLDENGNFLNGLHLEATLIKPGLEGQPLTLQQVAPGRYQASFEPDDPGAYFVRIVAAGAGESPAQPTLAQTAGWVLAYSPEYRLSQAEPRFLMQLAELTGGEVVRDPADIFAHNLAVDNATQPVWPTLLLVAVLLLPLDIALRRLIITRGDAATVAARVWQTINPLRRRTLAQAVPAARSGRVGRLFEAKKRARTDAPDATVTDRPSIPQAETTVPPATRSPAQKSSPAAAPSGTLAARLLDAKRSRQAQEDDADDSK